MTYVKDISDCLHHHNMMIIEKMRHITPNRLRRTNSTSRAEDIVTEDAKVDNARKVDQEISDQK